MWRGFMDRVLAETKVTEKFMEHDIRAKVSSDAESVEHARALLLHATTQPPSGRIGVRPSGSSRCAE
ncbi:hypothetical protein CNECB9_1150004 [Cupriavidus necator]|uniref:Uncharacterized protein n=1 Tax=Cupriavidus necator TaxID=106590 RepID=A0A1K0J6C0_CUPNE|nr:hypothetical protein CNECB9_1150004 [Cupriavidus necator]